jgi:hypothetical protein
MAATFVDFYNTSPREIVVYSNNLQISNYSLDKPLRTSIRTSISGYVFWDTGKRGRYGNDFRPNIFVSISELNLTRNTMRELFYYGNIVVNYGYPNRLGSPFIQPLVPFDYNIPPGNTVSLQLQMVYQLTRGDQWGYTQIALSFSSFSAVLLGL